MKTFHSSAMIGVSGVKSASKAIPFQIWHM